MSYNVQSTGVMAGAPGWRQPRTARKQLWQPGRRRRSPTGSRRGSRMYQRALWLPQSRSNMKMSGVT